MYSLNLPVSQLRTKVRQEFERHRYVNKLPVVDILLFRSQSEFQVCRTADDIQRAHAVRLSNHITITLRLLMHNTAGNTKLLEANSTRHEVLSGNGESDCKVTHGFHARLSGGRDCDYSSGV